MYLKVILLCFCILYANVQVSTSRHNIGTYAIMSQTNAITKDFETDPFLKKVLSKYYHVSDKRLNWYEALHKCRVLGGSLVHFQNELELNNTIAILNKKNCYWLDLTDLAEQGNFTSMTSGLSDTFLRWGWKEPNNMDKNERCVQLVAYDHKKFIMNDNKCDHKCKFICETKLPTQTNIVVW